MKIRLFSALVLPILTACGGGGGGGGTRPDAPNPGVPTKPANPYASPSSRNADRLTIPNGREVLVSVADSPVNPDHPELKGRIAGHLPTSTGAAPFASDSTANHGTAVASRIAGNELGFAGNARLLVSSPGVHLFDVNWTNDGHAWALSQGARVLNMSHQTSPSIMAAYGRTLNGAAAAGAVVTVGAGNAREDWSARQIQNGAVNPDSLIGANGRAALPYVLVVGATDPAGVRAETSGFAGANPEVQSRFLVAPGRGVTVASGAGGYVQGSGTSLAAPVVAAGAATVMSLWPHLGGDAVASLLLSTASKRSELFARNDCGADGKANCGHFYLGQGELDMTAALKPTGALSIPTGKTVADGGVAAAASSAHLAGGFGDAARKLAGLQVSALDEIGRDYGMDLAAFVHGSRTAFLPVSQRMARITDAHAARLVSPEQRASFDGMEVRVQYGADGSIRQMFAHGAFTNGLRWSAFSRASSEVSAVADVDAMAGLQLLSMQGTERPETAQALQSGLALGVALSDRVSLDAAHWLGHGAAALAADDRGSAQGSRLSLGFRPTEDLSVRVGAGVVREEASFMGSLGRGALAFGRGAQTRTASLGFDYRIDPALSVFARHEIGRLDNLAGNGMLRELSGARTSETALGIAWTGKVWRAALVASEPLRVSGATARFNLPVGRTVEGEVLTRGERVSLSPSGRQRNLELAFARPLGDSGMMSVNVLRAEEPGHVRGAKAEHAVMVQGGWKF